MSAPATHIGFGPPAPRGSAVVVHEIYPSIQGESTYAGRPCVFVRLTACHLRCVWCDTPHAFHEGTRRPVDDVVHEALAHGIPLVEVTGGEPLLQPDVYPLMQRLLDSGKTVLIETGGHRSIKDVPDGVIRIVDVKCPGSGEADKNDWSNLAHLRKTDEVKFVIADRRDYEYARDLVQRETLTSRVNAVLFSPVHGELDPKELSKWVIADGLDVRVQLQVHKYIWSPETRGV